MATVQETLRKLDEFTRSYLETALWSSMDESDESGGEPMDASYGLDDIEPEAMESAIEDCRQFQESHWNDIASDPAQAGGDFWLTRNRHGAGFWDGDWEKGSELTEAAHVWGSVDLYVGDDGLIYGF